MEFLRFLDYLSRVRSREGNDLMAKYLEENKNIFFVGWEVSKKESLPWMTNEYTSFEQAAAMKLFHHFY